MPQTQTPIDSFLAPLAQLAARFPDLEAAVIWAAADGWQAQDDRSELLDAEEITFYAEGLLQEGFGMIWQAVAAAASPTDPDHILLMFWQGTAPAVPAPPEGWRILAQAAWSAPQT